MYELNFKIENSFDGVTLEKFLKDTKGMSSRTLKKLKHTQDGLKRNGEHIRSVDFLKAGDTVTLTFSDEPQLRPSYDLPLSIVYEDEDFLVCNKDGQTPTHPSLAHPADSLANAASAYFADKGSVQTVRIINRLDKDTSGLVLIAKHRLAACAVSGRVKKTYFALAEGCINGKGVIDAPIRREFPESKKRIVASDGERAITEYEAIDSKNGTTLLKINLLTGRTHQIRVHFLHFGHHLVGDKLYNDGIGSELPERQALHCGIIEWENQIRGTSNRIAVNFPDDMSAVLRNLGYTYSIE